VIVLDENLDEQRVRAPLARRHKGKVISVRELRPGTVIKDEAIPAILSQHHNATFVTTNVSDFWRRVPAHTRYCIVCAPLPTERQHELPDLILRLLREKAFCTARRRTGKVIRVNRSAISFYEVGRPEVTKLSWERVV
jgi:hypothetical protein